MPAIQKTTKAVPPRSRRRTAGKEPENLERRREPTIKVFESQPFLTGIQERIADLIGELIVFGGTRRNLDMLCKIAADQEARRIYGSIMEGKPVSGFEKAVSERAAHYSAEWYDELAAARANRPQLPEAIRPEPKTVSDLILSNTRGEVKDYFDGFLNGAMPAELSFMWQVMTTWESIHQTHEATGFEAFWIANAFEDQIRRNQEYVRVPRHLVDDVEAYLKAMLRAKPEVA